MDLVMAKAKPKASKTGPKPNPEGAREDLIAIKCRAPYKAWVVKLGKSHRMTVTQIIDLALVQLAQQEGFEAPPER